MMRLALSFLLAGVAAVSTGCASPSAPRATPATAAPRAPVTIHYRKANVEGVNVFYREGGPANGPVVLLLHGFPTSSHMFRNLLPHLADRYRVIAPDYPGFGQSDAPNRDKFAYTFGHYCDIVDGLLAQLNVSKYAMYVMDYGAPVGYRLALKHPERVSGLIVQNGNAYEEGLREFWDPIKKYWSDGSAQTRDHPVAAAAPISPPDVRHCRRPGSTARIMPLAATYC